MSNLITTANRKELKAIIQLTRWKEHAPFIILTLLGTLVANSIHNTALDWRLIVVTGANIVTVAYAFMINDIEDAEDDTHDPKRAARNPVTSGEITVSTAYLVCRIAAAVALFLYISINLEVGLIGGFTLLLSHLYSWNRTRLKGIFPLDIISHSLMLGGLLVLSGYFTYRTDPGIIWLVAVGATLGSMYGQLYNQLRDFRMDHAAGLRNTAITLGEPKARLVMYISAGLAGFCIVAAALQGAFPLWLGIVIPFSFAISMLINPKTDMRGGTAVEISGTFQIQFWVAACLTTGIWLTWTIVTQLLFLS